MDSNFRTRNLTALEQKTKYTLGRYSRITFTSFTFIAQTSILCHSELFPMNPQEYLTRVFFLILNLQLRQTIN